MPRERPRAKRMPLGLWASGPLGLWASGPLGLWADFTPSCLRKLPLLILSLPTVRSPLPPSTPHTDGTSSPNCISFGSSLLMGFMGCNGNF